MKNLLSILMIVLLCGMSQSSFALDGKSERFLNKNKAIIDDAAPDDWYTLASCAEQCMKKNIINKDIAEWIDRSLEIKKTPYNLEIKGDYYLKNKLPEKAGFCYLEAIKIGLMEDKNFDASELQTKIARIVDLKK